MPTIHQRVIESKTSAEEANGSLGHSHKDNIIKGFPGSPGFTDAPSDYYDTGLFGPPNEDGEVTSEKVEVNFTDEALREFYGKIVMNGSRNIPGSDYAEGVSMDYQSNAVFNTHDKKDPTGDEPAAGMAGSSIAPGGLGPSVNTMDIDHAGDTPAIITDEDGADVELDSLGPNKTSEPPFVGDGSKELGASSYAISGGGLYGGGSYAGSGIVGKNHGS